MLLFAKVSMHDLYYSTHREKVFYVICVSTAATTEEGSGVILRTSPRKGVNVKGKEVRNPEGTNII